MSESEDPSNEESTFACKYCHKEFLKKYLLTRHMKSSKKCLVIQGKSPDIENFSCEYCGKKYRYKGEFIKHQDSCKQRSKFLIDKYQKKINELEKENKKLKRDIKKHPKISYDFDDKIKPFTKKSLSKKLKEIPFTESNYNSGLIGVSNYIKDLIVFIDDKGDEYPNYILTDASRKKFKRYTRDGEWVYDNKGEYLIKILMKCMGDIIAKLADEYFRKCDAGNFKKDWKFTDSTKSLYYQFDTKDRENYHNQLLKSVARYCRVFKFGD